ncbi:MAG: 23S rRNA (adenine(2503)-C(2))-methyltransferase RlmN [Actinomycetota bacterium]|nr:23S rRNA (adenine(2503)-C(2))-methyltransferase RlmN [Actinomycetota bacterium]
MESRETLLGQVLDNQPPYRIKQAQQAVYKLLVSDWAQASSLPKNLRQELQEKVPLDIKAEPINTGGALKAVIGLDDGLSIESVCLRHKHRNTVCVSSQVGCPLDCLFCHTGKLGFNRNLTAQEITDQVLYFFRLLKEQEQTVSNVVFMGMGEPLLNYSQVIEAIKILNHPDKFGLSARKISVSTAGITPKIKELSHLGLQVNLAISLNAPTNELRSKIMPVNKKYPLPELMEAVEQYISLTRRKVMFEYVMIKGLNDSPRQASQLASLLNGLLAVVNLIPYNGGGQLSAPSQQAISAFKEILSRNRIQATQRYRLGTSIAAACGQLLYQQGQSSSRRPLKSVGQADGE